LNTTWQHKVFPKLLGLQYKIIYKKGTGNRLADALSRISHDSAEVYVISSVSPNWLLAVQSSYEGDSFAAALIAKLYIDSSYVPGYSLKDGLLRYKSRIWIGDSPAVHKKLISALHDTPVGGHSDVPATNCRLKQLFAWKGMKADVQSFVKDCQVCL
jgi:hypothetical protein